MNEVIEKNEINVESMIYEIRGKQVMLDSDLARLYECKNGTKTINLAVKRNIERFPKDFYFQLTETEFMNWFQIETGLSKNLKHSSTLPYAFTEQGVAMLSSVLHTEIAIKKSVLVMRSFVAMRKYISSSLITNNIEHKLLDHDNRIRILEKTFDNLHNKDNINSIFFEGQIYDAYSLMMDDILSTSKKEIIIIDNYVGRELLNLIKDIKINIKIYSNNLDIEAIKKYQKQYSNIEIFNTDKFYDRFIIIDNNVLYHYGSSFKDLGKKCFDINKIIDEDYLNKILNILEV